ncbi:MULTISPECIES: type VI immunity family protein [unclassified Pseudomonas]|uniref:type VI immunity family protein n=1 Tax=unclassified Pseudomonas TaxID=196821 RepID=UPI000CD01E2F|nr:MULTISPECIES: type VI immunity family protein [unclassified Pseudomonas]POA68052.1 hypothetical protein C1888_18865 [Pseudomonas sp. GW531-T4]
MSEPFDLAAELEKMPFALEIPGHLLMKGGRQDYIGAALCIRGTLYFKDAHTVPVREELGRCFNDYQRLAGPELRWLWREEPPEGSALTPYNKARSLIEMLATMKENDHLSFYYTGGREAVDASPWFFELFGQRGWEAKMGDDLSVLEFSVPILFFEEHRLDFLRLFLDCAARLKAEQGYAGYALNLSVTKRDGNEATEAYMSESMPGLDAGLAPLLANRPEFQKNKIKTVSWLTVLNKPRLESAGGLKALQARLPDSHFAFYDYGAGVIIQAGNEPSVIGDADFPRPPAYVLLNHELKELRYETVGDLHGGSHDGEVRLTGWSADQWLKRFDVPLSELSAYQHKLSEQPALSSQYTLKDRLPPPRL